MNTQKLKFKKQLLASLLVTGLTIAATSQANAAYTFTDLGALDNLVNLSQANGINNAGQVVGKSVGNGAFQAILWNGTTMTVLGVGSNATAINNSGQVTGYVEYGGFTSHALEWTGGTATDIGTLGGYGSPSASVGGYPAAINDAGQIVGKAYTYYNNNGVFPVLHATIWNGTTVTDLTPTNTGVSSANDINNVGVVVGSSTYGSTSHATVWNGASITDLGTLGGVSSNATAINDSGLIVGSANITGSSSISHAVAWNASAITDLGTLGGASSFASAVNNGGKIVGYSLTASGVQHATLWDGIAPAIDLNSFLDAATVSAGWVLTQATGINDNGWIVGNASNSLTRVSHAFVLAAVPEPDTYAMALMGLGLMGFISRRRKADKSN